jgi:hypothetical protein
MDIGRYKNLQLQIYSIHNQTSKFYFFAKDIAVFAICLLKLF